ncbi:MAG TPA: 2-phospho-L-lactate guanylyltransferase [Nitrolancea sp.]|jgi:2-phospho-L-lactate guanylyltransferase|nr:2-phospho-L-lactate guanylyltransferase [Nitrolancea sp.]
MSLHAIVPVQRLEQAKSRLAVALSPEERRALVLRSLATVLHALSGSALVDATLVVTPDPEVSEHATHAGAIALEQPGRGLNEAIRQGREYAAEHGADALLIVLADLPLLTTIDIDNLLEASGDAAVTLAPDRHGSGTNALVLRPLNAIEPAFGVDSYHAHRNEAEQQQRSSRTFHARGTAYDVDTADDLLAIDRLLAGTVRSSAEPRALFFDRG